MFNKWFLVLTLTTLIFNISCKKNPTSSENEVTVTDIDGNVYNTIQIGDQLWMAENLKVTHYRNGEAIPNVTGISNWGELSSGAYFSYDNNDSNTDTYGLLYNWYTVNDSRNLAPAGWQIPTDEEWDILVNYLGGEDIAGGKMKETGTTHWNSPNTGATNSSGFTAVPGGYRNYSGTFYYMGYAAYFWSATEHYSYTAWRRILYCHNSGINRHYSTKQVGFSVRCLRDLTI